MNRPTSRPAGPKGTEMNSTRRAQAAVQQNQHALHPSLSARFSRRSRENLGCEELASRAAFRAPGLAHTSAARTMMISRRLVGTLFSPGPVQLAFRRRSPIRLSPAAPLRHRQPILRNPRRFLCPCRSARPCNWRSTKKFASGRLANLSMRTPSSQFTHSTSS